MSKNDVSCLAKIRLTTNFILYIVYTALILSNLQKLVDKESYVIGFGVLSCLLQFVVFISSFRGG